jgi:ribosomal protein S18 acetylase RimI-like enzyme
MIQLRVMTTKEFPAYCEYFVADYSRDIAKNQGLTNAKALEVAKQTLEQSFPQGLDSQGQQLLCIEHGSALVGYLWHSINLSDNSSYIYDFYIFPHERNKGFGKLAIEALELMLAASGVQQIKLRVAFHNQRALKLYEEVGFAVTGYNMSKSLS